MSNSTIKNYTLNSLADLGKTNTSVVKLVSRYFQLEDHVIYNIKLVISELIINGFIHGNKQNNMLELELTIDKEASTIVIIVDDGGQGFDTVDSIHKPDVESEQGRGLILVRAFTKSIIYNNIGNKVKVTIQI